MPILNAYEVRNVLVFNLNEKPGYSGIHNMLYYVPTILLLFGAASKTVFEIFECVESIQSVQGVRV